jgi:RNA polymerase sigma-70 factor (ECF subfamily)
MVRHLDRMYRAARALCGSPHDADDLVQDTYAQLLAKRRVIRNDDELGYLLTALRNTHINRRRTAARRPQVTEMPDGIEIGDEAASVPDQVRAGEVMGFVAALPDDLRQAITAVDVLDLSQAEAARRLDVSEHVLGQRLKRARAGVGARLFAGGERVLAECR